MSAAVADRPAIPDGGPSLPDGPRTPTAWNGLVFLVARDWAMRRMKASYGDMYTVKLPGLGTSVVVSHPDLVKQVFTADPTVLHAGENPLGQVLGPGSIFSMDEDRHLEERRMLLPPFHGDRMRSYEPLVEEETLRAVASWPDDLEFPSLPTFNLITLRVIIRAIFGAEGTQLEELQALLPRMAALGQRFVTAPFLGRDLGRFSPGGRMERLKRRYRRSVDVLIDRNLADPHLDDRIDILAIMLRSLRDSGGRIDHGELADELLTLLLAGHETTSSSLAWTIERLRRHPDVLRRLQEEAPGDDNALRVGTILEVQRVRPVINSAAPRRVVKPFELDGRRLPAGVSVVTLATVMHNDERFHEHASRFDPDRYVDRKPDTYSWIPFGGGRRRCIGASFAQMEMDIVLRTLMRHFEILPVPADDPPERDSFRGLAFAPAKGGMLRVRRRPQPLGGPNPTATSAVACPVAHDAAPACPVGGAVA